MTSPSSGRAYRTATRPLSALPGRKRDHPDDDKTDVGVDAVLSADVGDAPMRQRQYTVPVHTPPAQATHAVRATSPAIDRPGWACRAPLHPADWWALGEERSGSEDRCTSRAVSGASDRSQSTTHPRLVTKSGQQFRFGSGCASRACGVVNSRKEPCLLVITPVSVLASDGAAVPRPRRDNFRDNCGDNRVRASRDVVYT